MDMKGRFWCRWCGDECATIADYELVSISEDEVELVCHDCRGGLPACDGGK
jgi:hypothetical protein